MIVISAALLFAAIVLLVLGVFVVQMLVLVYASIIACVLAAILLGLGTFFQRDEILARAGETAEGERSGKGGKTPALAGGGSSPSSAGGSGGKGTSSGATRTATQQRAVGPPTRAGEPVPDDAVVFVVPGRPYYHLASCRQLGKREKSESRYAEARDNGYAACRACMPDTALVARAGARSGANHANGANGTNGANGAAANGTADGGDGDRTAVAAPEPEGAGDTPEDTADARGGAEKSPDGEQDRSGDSSADSDDSPRAGLVGVVQGSNRYHRLTCAVVDDAVQDGIELTTMNLDEAETEGATRCTVCLP